MKRKSSKEEFDSKRSNVGKIIFIFCLFFMLVFVSAVSVTLGSYSITAAEVYSIILQCLFQSPETTKEIIVCYLRLPRILMGILAGICLGIAGSIMRGVLKNPLASPYTLGIASSAVFGAVIATILGLGMIPIIGKYYIIGVAFIFALVTSLFILYLANRIGATPFGIVVITVVGIAIMLLFAYLTIRVFIFFEPEAIKVAYFLMLGDLGRASWDYLLPTFVILFVCCFLLLIIVHILGYKYKSWDFSAIEIGTNKNEDQRKGIKRIRAFLIAIAALLVATTVSFTGAIPFVGLIAPHIAYKTIGKDNRFLLIASALLGALILVGADTLARRIMPPFIFPVGVITSLIGIPLFIYLLIILIFIMIFKEDKVS